MCLTPFEPRTQVASGMETRERSSFWVRFSRTPWVQLTALVWPIVLGVCVLSSGQGWGHDGGIEAGKEWD